MILLVDPYNPLLFRVPESRNYIFVGAWREGSYIKQIDWLVYK